jgi:membrane dipeptidase
MDYESAIPLADDMATKSVPQPEGGGAELDRAARLLAAEPAISLHDHPIRLPEPLTEGSWEAWRAQDREELGYEGLRHSGLGGVFAGCNSWHGPEGIERWALRMHADLIHEPGLFLAEDAEDLRDRKPPTDLPQEQPAGPDVGVFLALETVTPLAGNLRAIEHLRRLRFRMVGVTGDAGNAYGGGRHAREDAGLTSLGREWVTLMNHHGLLIDLTHAGDRTSMDVIRVSQTPAVISHSGARGVWPSPRMKPDTLLRALADTGGVIGIEATPGSTRSPAHPGHSILSVLDHLDYLLNLIGIDHVGFGPNTFFGDYARLQAARRHDRDYETPPEDQRTSAAGPAESAQEPIGCVDGLENPRENFRNLAGWLVERGFSDEEVLKLLGRNALRVIATARPS